MQPQPEKLSVAALSSAAKNIDTISKAAMEAFASPESFEKELAVASAVQEMRLALTPAVMSEVMALMNTTIGFDTDKNPVKTPGAVPYSVEVVRDVFIESRLRGFHIIGKEFTIISGNFYAGVTGLDRLVRTHKRVANFRDSYDVPRSVAGGEGALVKCKADWMQFAGDGRLAADGSQQVLEREFSVRVNKGQGADAVLGKAKRKLLAAVLSRLTGTIVPEGDADDVPMAPAKPEAPRAEALFSGAAKVAEPVKAPDAVATPQQELQRFLDVESGVSFEDFRSFITTKNIAKDADSWATWDEVPAVVCEAIRTQVKTTAELIRKFGKTK